MNAKDMKNIPARACHDLILKTILCYCIEERYYKSTIQIESYNLKKMEQYNKENVNDMKNRLS